MYNIIVILVVLLLFSNATWFVYYFNKKEILTTFSEKRSTRFVYENESVKSILAIQIRDILKKERYNERDLARWLKITDDRMNRILSAGEDVSIELLIDIAIELGRKLEINFIKENR
jgi:hypothetical protein